LILTSRPARGPRTLDITPRSSPVPVCACIIVLQAQTRDDDRGVVDSRRHLCEQFTISEPA
jgi:hypothetical protein